MDDSTGSVNSTTSSQPTQPPAMNLPPGYTLEPPVSQPAPVAQPTQSSSSGKYSDLIGAAAKKYGIDSQLVTAIANTESNYDTDAVSRKNAQGVMQLLPETSAQYGVRDPFDPAQNIDAGAHYFKDLLTRFHGDTKLALAAYDAGPERVEQYGGVPPFPETQKYVEKILGNKPQQSLQQKPQSPAINLPPGYTLETPQPTEQNPQGKTAVEMLRGTSAPTAAPPPEMRAGPPETLIGRIRSLFNEAPEGSFLRELSTSPHTDAVHGGRPTGQEAPSLLSLKTWLTPSEQTQHPVLQGTNEFVDQFASAGNMFLMAATAGEGAFPKMLSNYFAAQAVKGMYDSVPEFKKAIENKDWGEVKRLSTHMVLNAAMTAGMTKHMAMDAPAALPHGYEPAAPQLTPDVTTDADGRVTKVTNPRTELNAKGQIASLVKTPQEKIAQQAADASRRAQTARDAQSAANESEAQAAARAEEKAGAFTQAEKAKAQAQIAKAKIVPGDPVSEAASIEAQNNASAAQANYTRAKQAHQEALERQNEDAVSAAQANYAHQQAVRAMLNTNPHPTAPPPATPATPEEIAQGYRDWHEQRDIEETARKKLDPLGVNDTESAFGKAFAKAFPEIKSASYGGPKGRRIGEIYLKDYQDNVAPIENTQELINALQYQSDAMDDAIGGTISEPGDEPAVGQSSPDVQEALADVDKVKAGFLDAGLKSLEPYGDVDNLTLNQLEALRKNLAAELRSIKQRNLPFDRSGQGEVTLRQTDPEFAAKDALYESARRRLNETLESKGVDGVREMRSDQKVLIDLKRAVERQKFKGESTVKGTSGAGIIRKGIAKAVHAGAIGGGAAIGGPFGAVVGERVGAKLSEAIAPSDLNRDAAVKQMAGKMESGNGPRKLIVGEPPAAPPTPIWPPSEPPFVPPPAPSGEYRNPIGGVWREETQPVRGADLADVPLADRGGVIRRQPFTTNRGLALPPGPDTKGLPPIGGSTISADRPAGTSTSFGLTRGAGYAPIELPASGTADVQPRNQFTPLHADLATHYGEALGDTPYQELEDRFKFDVATKREHGVALDASEKALLKAMNVAKVQEIGENQKMAEKAAEEAQKATEEAEKEQAKQLKLNAEAKAPFPIGPEQKEPEGFLEPPSRRFHELGHVIVLDKVGFPVVDVISSYHPLSEEGAQSTTRFDKSSLMTEGGRFSPSKIAARIGDIVTTLNAGRAARELAEGISAEDDEIAFGDNSTIDEWLNYLGINGERAESIKQQGLAQAREILAPHAEVLQKYGRHRQAGLAREYDISKDVVQQMLKEIRGENNEPETDNDTTGAGKPVAKDGEEREPGREGKDEGGAPSIRPDGKLGEAGEEGRGGERGIKTEARREDFEDARKKANELRSQAGRIRPGQKRQSLVAEADRLSADADKQESDYYTQLMGGNPEVETYNRDTGELEPKIKAEARRKTKPAEESETDPQLPRAGGLRAGEILQETHGKAFIDTDGSIVGLDREHEDTVAEHLGLEPPENEDEMDEYEEKLQHKVDDLTKQGVVRVAGYGVKDSPLYVQLSGTPNEAQRAVIGKAIRDQGSAVYDLTPDGFLGRGSGKMQRGKIISGEAYTPGDLWTKVNEVFSKKQKPLLKLEARRVLRSYDEIQRDVEAEEKRLGDFDTSPKLDQLYEEREAALKIEKPKSDAALKKALVEAGYPEETANKIVENKPDVKLQARRASAAEDFGLDPEKYEIIPKGKANESQFYDHSGYLLNDGSALFSHEWKTNPEAVDDEGRDLIEHRDIADDIGRNELQKMNAIRVKGMENLELTNRPTEEQLSEIGRFYKETERSALTWDLWKNGKRAVYGHGTPGEFRNEIERVYPEEPKIKTEARRAPTTTELPSAKEAFELIKQKYGESTDASKTGSGASFITPEGKFVHLGSSDHPEVIDKAGYQSDAQDTRVPFINESGAVRSNFTTGRAGRTLSFSVPNTGVNAEQMDAMKRAVRDGLGTRNGQLRIETADSPTNLKNSIKDFATANDVEPMLREIKAHPESKETSTPKISVQIADINPSNSLYAREGINRHTILADGKPVAKVHTQLEDGTLSITWLGAEGGEPGRGGAEGKLGAAGVRQVGRQLKAMYPDAQQIEYVRQGGLVGEKFGDRGKRISTAATPSSELQESAQRYAKEHGLPEIDHLPVEQDVKRAEEVARIYDQSPNLKLEARRTTIPKSLDNDARDENGRLLKSLGSWGADPDGWYHDDWKGELRSMYDALIADPTKATAAALKEAFQGALKYKLSDGVPEPIRDAYNYVLGGPIEDIKERIQDLRKSKPIEKESIEPWAQKAANDAEKQGGGFTINPKTGEAPKTGYQIEVSPEDRQLLDHPATAKDIQDFARKHEAALNEHPELHIGGYGNELNLSAHVENLDQAKGVANKLDQISIWDNAKGEEIPTGGTGKTREFPDYPLEQRFADLRGEPSLKLEARRKAADQTDVRPVGSSVGLRTNPLPIKASSESGVPTTVDVAQALNEFTKEKLPELHIKETEPDEMKARAKSIGLDEAKYQLAQNNTGAAWYTTDMKKHDEIVQDMRPALEDPAKLSLFKMVEAILSAGTNPFDNIKHAVRAWDAYEETGKFPLKDPDTNQSWGRYAIVSYSRAIDSINKLIDEKGEKGASEWLLAEHPIKELHARMEPTQTRIQGSADDLMPGVMILGPKRGPFAQNLHGLESAFTADMWVSRTWHRWMGTTEVDPDGELKTDRPQSARERTLMKDSFSEAAKELNMTTSSLQAVLWYYEQALYQAHGANASKETWSFSDAAKRLRDEEDSSFNFGANERKAANPNEIKTKKALDILAGKE